jgi:hypothetical protein
MAFDGGDGQQHLIAAGTNNSKVVAMAKGAMQ